MQVHAMLDGRAKRVHCPFATRRVKMAASALQVEHAVAQLAMMAQDASSLAGR
jgi:hypothetical protein